MKALLAIGAAGLRLARTTVLNACCGALVSPDGAPAEALRIVAVCGKGSAAEADALEILLSQYETVARSVRDSVCFRTRFSLSLVRCPASAPAGADGLLLAALGIDPASDDARIRSLRFAAWLLSEGTAIIAPLLGDADTVLFSGSSEECEAAVALRILPEKLRSMLKETVTFKAAVQLPCSDPDSECDPESASAAARALLGELHGYDRIDAVGLPESDWILADRDGLRVPEWLLSISAADALTTNEKGFFAWSVPVRAFGWALFGTRMQAVRTAWGGMTVRTAAFYAGMLQPLASIIDAKGHGIGTQMQPSAGWFRGAPDDRTGFWDEQRACLDAFASIARIFTTGMHDMIASLPERFCIDEHAADEIERVGQAYRRLIEARAVYDELADQHRSLTETDAALVQRIPGKKDALDQADISLQGQRKKTEELEAAFRSAKMNIEAADVIQIMKQMRAGLRIAIRREEQDAENRRAKAKAAMNFPEERQNYQAIERELQAAARLESHTRHLRTEAKIIAEELKRELRSSAHRKRIAAAGSQLMPETLLFDGEALDSACSLFVNADKARRERSRDKARLERLAPGLVRGVRWDSPQTIAKNVSRAARGGKHQDPVGECLSFLLAYVAAEEEQDRE